jgi:hypothetical protein
MNHPPMFRLESFIAGTPDAEVQAHLKACAACQALTAQWQSEHAAFQNSAPVDSFLAKVSARAANERGAEVETESKRPSQRPSLRVVAASNTIAQSKAKMRWLPWASAGLAAAAGLLLVLRSDHAQFGPTQGREHPQGESAPSNDISFKGAALQLAIIRERGAEQVRLTGGARSADAPILVRAGDRIRAEVVLESARPVQIVLVRDDGKRWPLLAATALEAGVSFSPESIRFDHEPFTGRILAGEVSRVEEAILGQRTDGVRVIRIQSE